MKVSCSSVKIPLIFGAAGHRDIPIVGREEMEACVRGELIRYQQKFPHTPLILLSQLSPGADRLLAAWATRPESTVKLTIVEVEGRSASTDDPDPMLEDLRKRAKEVIVLRSPDGASLRHGGAFIARQSQVLLALWDGRDTPESHTAQVIRWQREGGPDEDAEPLGLLDKVECGPVCHVTTGRANQSESVGKVRLEWLYPVDKHRDQTPEQAAEGWEKFLGQINEFNADLDRLSAKPALTANLDKSAGYLLPADKASLLSEPLQATRLQHAAADTLAQHFQKKVKSTHWLLLGMIFLAGVAFATYAHFLIEHPTLLLVYLGIVCGAWGLTSWVSQRHYHRKWLDYRAMAEAMRVEFFWKLAGLPLTAADHYLRNLRSEVDWIRAAIRAWEISSGYYSPAVSTSETSPSHLDWCQEYWVKNQEDYFLKKAKENHKSHKIAEGLTKWAFRLGIGFSVALLGYQLATQHPSHPLIVAMVLSSLVAALLHHAETTAGYSMLARSYEWMHGLYSLARNQLDDLMTDPAANRSQAQSLIKELGREALAENGYWLLYHRERPPRLPHVEG